MESVQQQEPWNKGKLIGQKPPLKPKDIWAIRIQLQNAQRDRDLAMFNLAIDSKLRGCDLVSTLYFQVGYPCRPIYRPGSILGSADHGSPPRVSTIRSGFHALAAAEQTEGLAF